MSDIKSAGGHSLCMGVDCVSVLVLSLEAKNPHKVVPDLIFRTTSRCFALLSSRSPSLRMRWGVMHDYSLLPQGKLSAGRSKALPGSGPHFLRFASLVGLRGPSETFRNFRISDNSLHMRIKVLGQSRFTWFLVNWQTDKWWSEGTNHQIWVEWQNRLTGYLIEAWTGISTWTKQLVIISAKHEMILKTMLL